MSPEMITTARLGRYQRSWKALRLAPFASVSAFSVPIGERSASRWPAKNVSRNASWNFICGPGCSRRSASTIGRSAATDASVRTGEAIMPDRMRSDSSSPASVADGRSSR